MPRLQRLVDRYSIQAGDVALAWAGRGFNPLQGRWITVSGGTLGDSRMMDSMIVRADLQVQSSAGVVVDGVYIMGFILQDPGYPDYSSLWFQGVQSKVHQLSWIGRIPLAAGFVWRIHQGGLIAGDLVAMDVQYE